MAGSAHAAGPMQRLVNQADYVGHFRTGRRVDNRPESLATWRVTMAAPNVATDVARLLGGEPAQWETTTEDSWEVLTDYDTVRIVLDGPSAVQVRMVLFGYKGKKLHECDGAQLLAPEVEAGKPCGCPSTFEERRLEAKSGRGPAPSTSVAFRLAAEPALGEFRFASGSWELLKTVPDLQHALEDVDGPATCEITLELVKCMTASGTAVSYRKPVIRVLGDPSAPEPRPAPKRSSVPLVSPAASSDVPAPVQSPTRLPSRRRPAPEPQDLLSGSSGTVTGRRIEYYNDPDAPKANTLIPASNLLVVDDHGAILLQRRRDTGQWALPGGAQDIGETAAQCAVRECLEETGIVARITGFLGVYTDPNHIVAYADGEIRQQYETTYIGRPVNGEPTVNDEADAVRFVQPVDLAQYAIHRSMRQQIGDYLAGTYPYLG